MTPLYDSSGATISPSSRSLPHRWRRTRYWPVPTSTRSTSHCQNCCSRTRPATATAAMTQDRGLDRKFIGGLLSSCFLPSPLGGEGLGVRGGVCKRSPLTPGPSPPRGEGSKTPSPHASFPQGAWGVIQQPRLQL